MSTLGTIGRFLYGLPMIVFGSFHFMRGPEMAGMVPVPGGTFWIYLTGAALIAAGVAIVIDKWAAIATALLGALLLTFALTIHLPGVLGATDAAAQQASMSNLLKDTALAGAAWAFSAMFAGRHPALATSTDRTVETRETAEARA